MELKAVFECKPAQFRCRNIKIEKVVHISSEDYEAFFQRPMMEQNFISENIEQMHLGTDGAYHCILVMGQGHRDGILVLRHVDIWHYNNFLFGSRCELWIQRT